MYNKKHKKGFTLIELLVAVSLMLILMGAIVIIFGRSTKLFDLSEANMNIFQNARVAFDTMAKELASSRGNLTIAPTTANTDPQTLLSFRSIVNFNDATGTRTGLANVSYIIAPVQNSGNRRWRLRRNFVVPDPNDPTPDTPTLPVLDQGNDILCQFINAPSNGVAPGITFTFASYVENTNGDDDEWNLNQADPAPDAVRVAMDITDDQNRIIRTVSRVFWIANPGN